MWLYRCILSCIKIFRETNRNVSLVHGKGHHGGHSAHAHARKEGESAGKRTCDVSSVLACYSTQSITTASSNVHTAGNHVAICLRSAVSL